MRHSQSGAWVAEPGDDSGIVFAHWGDFTPARVVLNDEAGDQFMFGGVVLDDSGLARSFDGFESVDDARTFAVETLGVPADRVSTLEG